MNTLRFRSVGECMAELQLAKDGLYSLKFGGDTLNTTWYVRALSAADALEVEYVTAAGSDPLSGRLLEFLNDNLIGTKFIKTVVDRNIGLYLISLSGAERNFTYWRNNSAAKLLAENKNSFPLSLANADVVYFSAITLAILSPEHRQILLNELSQLKAAGAAIAFDSNARPKLWSSVEQMREATIQAYKVATVALPTFSDEQAMFGDRTPANTAKRIADYGVNEVVVKNGANASWSLVNGDLFDVTPEPVRKVIDTTGAGDSFNAGYLVGCMAKMDPRSATKLGHHIAGLVIGHHGALVPMSVFSDIRLSFT